MTPHGRKRGDKPSYPICVWNGILEPRHLKRIGIALWEFLWLIDAITEEQDGIGWVYGKTPLKIERIASDLGIGDSTVRRNLGRLKDGGYIVTQQARYGLIVGVVNSRKIRPRTSNLDRPNVSGLESRPLKSEHSDRSKVSGLSPKSERSGDSILNDNAVRQSSRTAETPAELDSMNLWKVLGSDLPMGSLKFQKIFEHYFATRNGNPLSEAMERAIQKANKERIGVPPKFYEAKRAVERRETDELSTSAVSAVPELEAEPWAK